jgi:hypothetical protein
MRKELDREISEATRKMQAADKAKKASAKDLRSSDVWWHEKEADYWKGRRDGLMRARAIMFV